MSNYIVVRPAPDLPEGFLPKELNGKWFDVDDVPRIPPLGTNNKVSEAVAVPTGKFEVREDGAVAEIYEVRV